MSHHHICTIEVSVSVGPLKQKTEVSRLLLEGIVKPPLLKSHDSRTILVAERWDKRSSVSAEHTKGLPEPHEMWQVNGPETMENYASLITEHLVRNWWSKSSMAHNSQLYASVAMRITIPHEAALLTEQEFAPLKLPEVTLKAVPNKPHLGLNDLPQVHRPH